MMRISDLRLPILLLSFAVAGCNVSGDFLFPGEVEGLDDIYELGDQNGDPIVPADVATVDEVRAATIYAEVGPPRTTGYGGVTVNFKGTGGSVCLWVDPELATWNESVAQHPVNPDLSKKWTYPDNIFDDGDIDLFAGLSVYYTGSPGEKVGDFVVSYEDSLGNEIPISLASCPNTVGSQGDDATAGRGSPEYCTIPTTDEGIDYTVLLRTWSTPLDDDRLAYGFLLTNGSCDDLRAVMGATIPENDECVIEGEALFPEDGEFGPYYGFDKIPDGRIWDGSIDFEEAFCNSDKMKTFCQNEVERVEGNGGHCEWETIDDPADRCYCGNPENTPQGGAD